MKNQLLNLVTFYNHVQIGTHCEGEGFKACYTVNGLSHVTSSTATTPQKAIEQARDEIDAIKERAYKDFNNARNLFI